MRSTSWPACIAGLPPTHPPAAPSLPKSAPTRRVRSHEQQGPSSDAAPGCRPAPATIASLARRPDIDDSDGPDDALDDPLAPVVPRDFVARLDAAMRLRFGNRWTSPTGDAPLAMGSTSDRVDALRARAAMLLDWVEADAEAGKSSAAPRPTTPRTAAWPRSLVGIQTRHAVARQWDPCPVGVVR